MFIPVELLQTKSSLLDHELLSKTKKAYREEFGEVIALSEGLGEIRWLESIISKILKRFDGVIYLIDELYPSFFDGAQLRCLQSTLLHLTRLYDRLPLWVIIASSEVPQRLREMPEPFLQRCRHFTLKPLGLIGFFSLYFEDS